MGKEVHKRCAQIALAIPTPTPTPAWMNPESFQGWSKACVAIAAAIQADALDFGKQEDPMNEFDSDQSGFVVVGQSPPLPAELEIEPGGWITLNKGTPNAYRIRIINPTTGKPVEPTPAQEG